MLNQTQIREKAVSLDYDLKEYNDVFKAGYKMALRDVLEIKRPKAKPSKPSDNNDFKASAKDVSVAQRGKYTIVKTQDDDVVVIPEPSPKPCPRCNTMKKVWVVHRENGEELYEDCPKCNGQGFIKS